MTTELAVNESKLTPVKELDIESFAKTLIESKALPPSYNTVPKIFVAIHKGRELGMGPMTSLSNFSMINGVPTPSVHLLLALARKAGIRFTILKDAEVVYTPVLDEVGKPVMVDGVAKVIKDVVTTIRASEYYHGKWFENEFSYSWRDAEKAGLTTKDNWVKMPKIMLRTRCLAIAARASAPEATLGMLTDLEMSEIHNVAVEVKDVEL